MQVLEDVSATKQLLAVVDAVVCKCPWTKQKQPEELVQYTLSELDEVRAELAVLRGCGTGCMQQCSGTGCDCPRRCRVCTLYV